MASSESVACGRLKRLADAITEELADTDPDAKAAAERVAELEAENRRLRAELRAARAYAADEKAKAEELAKKNALIRRESEEKATHHAEEIAKLREELESMERSRDEANAKLREDEETADDRNADLACRLGAWKSAYDSSKQVQEAYSVKLKKLEADLAVESHLNAVLMGKPGFPLLSIEEQRIVQDESLFQWKMQVHDWLAHVVSSFWPTGELHVVGSSVKGCSSRDSDLDHTLLIAGPDGRIHVDREFAVYVLDILGKALAANPYCENVQFIDGANLHPFLIILHFLLHAVDPPVFHGFRDLSGREDQLDTLAFVRSFQPQLLKGTLMKDTTVARLFKGFFDYYANIDF